MARKRRVNKPPKYRLYKPKGLAVVRIDGVDHYLGRHGTPESWEMYHRLLAERRLSPATLKDDPDGVSVAALILSFWEYAQTHYRTPEGEDSGECGNIKVALRPLRRLYGTIPSRNFGPLALRAVQTDMVASGLARKSVNARINRIRRMFRWAASLELVPGSVEVDLRAVPPLKKGRTAARETADVGPVALEIVEATLPFLTRPVAGLVRLQLLTGMRPGEACVMRSRDLTPGEGTWTYRPASHKTRYRDKTREIILGPQAIELVKGYLKPDTSAYLFDPRDAVRSMTATRAAARASKVTPSEVARKVDTPGERHNSRYGKSAYRNAVATACSRAFPHPTIKKVRGKPMSPEDVTSLKAWRSAHRWHPNQLRHSAATAIRARYGLEAAQVVLGHSKADVTQVYADRDAAKAREVMREIG